MHKFGFESYTFEPEVFLDIDSVNKNAFLDLLKINSLHLSLAKFLRIDFSSMVNMKNLNEICLECKIDYDQDNESNYIEGLFPECLEKLSIMNFNIELSSFKHLKNLEYLELIDIKDIVIRDPRPFDCFEKLTFLEITRSKVSKTCSELEIQMGPLGLKELKINVDTKKCFEHFRVLFDNLCNLISFDSLFNKCQFDSVHIKPLRNLEELRILVKSLKQNELKELLYSLTKLRILEIAGIRIQGDIYLNLNNLEELAIFDSDLSEFSLKSDTFTNLTNLVRLELQRSNISQIEPGAFKYLKRLKRLNLKANKITSINRNAFEGLFNLEELDLSWNKITEIDVRTFDSLNNLIKLLLTRFVFNPSNVDMIKTGLFMNLKKLKHLCLDLNGIRNINENLFQDCSSLEELDLSYNCFDKNEIRTGTTFNNLTNLKIFRNYGKLSNKIIVIPSI